jgi:hypothetical protein
LLQSIDNLFRRSPDHITAETYRQQRPGLRGKWIQKPAEGIKDHQDQEADHRYGSPIPLHPALSLGFSHNYVGLYLDKFRSDIQSFSKELRPEFRRDIPGDRGPEILRELPYGVHHSRDCLCLGFE